MYFNVFEAAPENDRDGPNQQASQNVGGKVRHCFLLIVSLFYFE
jgi:serine/threonine-protein phosphatase PPG1